MGCGACLKRGFCNVISLCRADGMFAVRRLFAISRIRVGGMRRWVLSGIGTKYVPDRMI